MAQRSARPLPPLHPPLVGTLLYSGQKEFNATQRAGGRIVHYRLRTGNWVRQQPEDSSYTFLLFYGGTFWRYFQ